MKETLRLSFDKANQKQLPFVFLNSFNERLKISKSASLECFSRTRQHQGSLCWELCEQMFLGLEQCPQKCGCASEALAKEQSLDPGWWLYFPSVREVAEALELAGSLFNHYHHTHLKVWRQKALTTSLDLEHISAAAEQVTGTSLGTV